MNSRTKTFIISEPDEGKRLDAFLASQMVSESITRSYIQKLIVQGLVTVDGAKVKSGYKLKTGMNVVVKIPEPCAPEIVSQDIPLDIIFEDNDIIVINKPKDLVVHPAAGNWEGTLVNALLHHCRDSLSDINGVIRPGIVHRIDKDTSGLLVVAKNNNAHLKLSDQIKKHQVQRIYEAIVDGNIKDETGRISATIGRHPVNRKKMAANVKNGKPAVTHFKVIDRYKGYTHIQLKLETGRTHQIRVHMASIGHPVTGDLVYGKSCKLMNTEGQALHARYLIFKHPVSDEEMVFEAPLPDYFSELLSRLKGQN
ncbi:MAG: RluA family pseudouridine synthase [Clostridiaceae bacterium]|jgi:23S rRNA pseudouridine1911/1915/1917 synthase|nr:RluA family pseudouridine synthase [Clostridiaceae bacterium]